MDWLMEPLSGFKGISQDFEDSCPQTWNQCTCTGGLLICTVQGALKIEEPTE